MEKNKTKPEKADLEPTRFLQAQLHERQAVNPQYSLRAFARDLGLSPQQLSNMLNGRRTITVTTAIKVSDRLKLNPTDHFLFLELVRAKYSKSKEARSAALSRIQEFRSKQTKTTDLSLDLFKTIANWYHLALVELIRVDGALVLGELAKRLQLSENETSLALTRLERLQLIEKTKVGYRVLQDTVISDQGIPTEAVKSFHSQVLQRALHALQNQDQKQRYGSSSFLAVRTQDLELVKERVRRFRLELEKDLAERGPPDAVYALSMHWFSVTEMNNNQGVSK